MLRVGNVLGKPPGCQPRPNRADAIDGYRSQDALFVWFSTCRVGTNSIFFSKEAITLMSQLNLRFAPVWIAVALAGSVQTASAQCLSCSQTAAQLNLPPGQLSGVTVTHTFNTTDTTVFSAMFSGLPGGYAVGNGTYLAWCDDVYGDFSNDGASTPWRLYSSTIPSGPMHSA